MIGKTKAAIISIHDLMIRGRIIAFDSKSIALAGFLDKLEYLPALMLEEKDNSELYEVFLKEFCEEFDCIEIYEKFKKSS